MLSANLGISGPAPSSVPEMLADHPDVSDNLLLLLLQQTDISTTLPFCLNSLYLNTLDPYESVSKCQNKPFLP